MATLANRDGLLQSKQMFPHSNGDSYISDYVRMVTNPGVSKAVRAPAFSPYIASTTHVRRVLDITGANTNAGSYGVFVTPTNIFPYATSGALTNFPNLASAIWCHTDSTHSPNNDGCVLTVANSDSVQQSFASSRIIYNSLSRSAWQLALPAGTYTAQVVWPVPAADTSVEGTPQYIRLFAGSAGAWTAVCSAQYVVCGSVFPNFTFTIPVGGTFGFAIGAVDSTGADQNANLPAGMLLYFQATGRMEPTGSNVQFDHNHQKIINLEQSQTISHRITAMSMLISNMSSDLNNQGRLVIGRADPRVLSNYSTLADGQRALARLPDASRVYDGPLRDGGYTWYMPDDINSYEPRAGYSATEPNNILAAFISGMDTDEGSVRVVIDYVVEFYTPNQLLTRDPSPIWDDHLLHVFGELLSAPAASANFAHSALVGGIASAAIQAAKFYAANRSWIDPAVAGAYKAAMSKIAPKEKQKGASSSAPQKRAPQRPKR